MFLRQHRNFNMFYGNLLLLATDISESNFRYFKPVQLWIKPSQLKPLESCRTQHTRPPVSSCSKSLMVSVSEGALSVGRVDRMGYERLMYTSCSAEHVLGPIVEAVIQAVLLLGPPSTCSQSASAQYVGSPIC